MVQKTFRASTGVLDLCDILEVSIRSEEFVRGSTTNIPINAAKR